MGAAFPKPKTAMYRLLRVRFGDISRNPNEFLHLFVTMGEI